MNNLLFRILICLVFALFSFIKHYHFLTFAIACGVAGLLSSFCLFFPIQQEQPVWSTLREDYVHRVKRADKAGQEEGTQKRK